MTNTNKNAERKSIAKGIIANVATQSFDSFEVEINYTRSLVKAVPMIKEALNLDDNAMVSVTELVNEPKHKVVYDAGKIIDFARCIMPEKEKAESEVKDEYETVVEITIYEYSGYYWAHNGEDYITDYILDDSPNKMTKINMRQFLAFSAHNLTGYEVLAIHGEERTEVKRYAVIDKQYLDKCEVEK